MINIIKKNMIKRLLFIPSLILGYVSIAVYTLCLSWIVWIITGKDYITELIENIDHIVFGLID